MTFQVFQRWIIRCVRIGWILVSKQIWKTNKSDTCQNGWALFKLTVLCPSVQFLFRLEGNWSSSPPDGTIPHAALNIHRWRSDCTIMKITSVINKIMALFRSTSIWQWHHVPNLTVQRLCCREIQIQIEFTSWKYGRGRSGIDPEGVWIFNLFPQWS